MTDFSQGGARRYDTSIPASIRHNNPGASYPAGWMNKYGMQGHSIIGGGHKIAYFPSAIQGAAANFDLFSRGYAGMKLGDAIHKWSGGNSSSAYTDHVTRATGLTAQAPVTAEHWRNPRFAIPMLRAMAGWEKGPGGKSFQLSDDEWAQAHGMFVAGGGGAPTIQQPSSMGYTRSASQPVATGERALAPGPRLGNDHYGEHMQWSNGDRNYSGGVGSMPASAITGPIGGPDPTPVPAPTATPGTAAKPGQNSLAWVGRNIASMWGAKPFGGGPVGGGW